jgi:hypothetical protein
VIDYTAKTADTNDLPDQSNDQQQHNASTSAMPNISCYGRTRKLTRIMQESLEQCDIAFQAYYEAMHEEEYLLQDEMLNPIAFLAGRNEDTMYFHKP